MIVLAVEILLARLLCVRKKGKASQRSASKAVFAYFLLPRDIAFTEIKTKLPSLNPLSEDSLSKLRHWSHECASTHQSCIEAEAAKAKLDDESKVQPGPRRLLSLSRVDSKLVVKVVESSQPAQHSYVALSYCWGGDQRVKLRQANLDKWRQGLPYVNLPQTIKGAITVTMSLGASHLWVDALCIIQDSDENKAQEISRMGDIYEQAHFTITPPGRK